ncbi:Peptidyl-prolyl cis-trans isomerase PpiD [Pseudohaliea rubra DSM 19751]|uniref:peptidylprolyl isomerase n=2 Tax=Pseudohaliea TaxID=1341120 RepID=A0A095VTP7_9GAMM|nr:Peptidyl-prolyl cis-trans isomerase PpiD [Pseudohaliea rubra DSM 19751]
MLMPAAALAQVVISDEGVDITREEFEAVLATSPDKIKRRAANDLGDRFELITQLIASRKVAATAETLDKDDPGYWELQFKLLTAKEQFMFERLVADYDLPDFDELARERYKTQKDKYARYPELRASSHILFRSPPGEDRTELREKAALVLEELRAGADFEAYVQEYSEDPGSKKRAGSLDRWIRLGDPKITPPYSGALFEIDEIGGYSEVTDSQFGLHIIRLDGIQESGYAEYETVRPKIISDLRAEYKTLAAKEVRARFHLTDDAFIDGDAMEELLAPYKE